MHTATITQEPGSTVKITAEVSTEALEKHRAAAVAAVGAKVTIDGFRPGHIPEKVLVERVGEMAILSEMAERAIKDAYPLIIAEHTIDAIGYPEIAITKLAPGNPLSFTATVAVMPKITLPDYSSIAHTINSKREQTVVTDEDVDKEVVTIMKQKAAYDRMQSAAGHVHDEHCDHSHETSPEATTEAPLPELTDAYVAGLGTPGQFTSVENFKAKLKEHLTIERTRAAESTHRAKLTDAILEKSEIELPKLLVDGEINQMFAQMHADLEQAHLKMEDYLAHLKKTEAELRAEWVPNAEKRARMQLILNEIAKREELKPDEMQLESHVSALKAQYQNADEHRIRIYVASMLQNEAVMKLLETK